MLDGSFPTVASPNPENPEGFYLAIDLANQVGADFILGTDPDSDRVGIMVRNHDGSLCPRYRQPDRRAAAGLSASVPWRRAGKLPEHPVSPEDHRHHRDGPQGGRGQRRHLLRYLHGLQVHGREEERSWRARARARSS